MNLDTLAEQVEPLLRQFEQSGVAVLHLRSGDFELYLSRHASSASILTGTAPPPSSAPAASATKAAIQPSANPTAPAAVPVPTGDIPEGAVLVLAPNLGTFYRSPKPGAAPYVELGSEVCVGDEICLIEVMKLFTGVRAETRGRVVAILAQDGAMVEEGQPLLALSPL